MVIFHSDFQQSSESAINLLPLTGLIAAVILSGFLSELLGRKGILNREIARKLFHITASICAAYSVLLVDERGLLIAVAITAVVISFVIVKFKLLTSIHEERDKSWGIFYLPAAYALSVLFLFPGYKSVIFYSMLVLGTSDSLAAVIGHYFARRHFRLTRDKKSIPGSAAFFISTFALTIILTSQSIFGELTILRFGTFTDQLLFAFSAALILTVVEAISSSGSDNLFIPLFATILLITASKNYHNDFLLDLVTGIVLAAIVALFSIRSQFLTHSGSAATFILAGFIFGYGGWKWSIPIMTFFILSSLLSKIRKRENEKVESYFEKTGTRDYLQVLANGGLGGILVIYNQFNPSPVNYYIYLASLAAVCADTWATEIGTLRKRNTYNILNFKKTEQGVSGGISIGGTTGALLGSFVIALSGIYWVNLELIYYFVLILLSGLFGSFIDSFLGATIQAQGKCKVCSKITEREVHCEETTTHYRGLQWLNNDAVNFLAGASAALFLFLIY